MCNIVDMVFKYSWTQDKFDKRRFLGGKIMSFKIPKFGVD